MQISIGVCVACELPRGFGNLSISTAKNTMSKFQIDTKPEY